MIPPVASWSFRVSRDLPRRSGYESAVTSGMQVPTWKIEVAARWLGPIAAALLLSGLAVGVAQAGSPVFAVGALVAAALLVGLFVFRWRRDSSRIGRVKDRELDPTVRLSRAFAKCTLTGHPSGSKSFGKGWYEVTDGDFVVLEEPIPGSRRELLRYRLGDLSGPEVHPVQRGWAVSRAVIGTPEGELWWEPMHRSGSSYRYASDLQVRDEARDLRRALAE